ncbi:protoheme IX farnesyltransferase [Aeropyrum pernix K1]|nr:heme o synthase [Aeropyrum pernix]BAA80883.1 protoheme IX farnesyltransferase [Aeropyrum pernix K1]
MGKMVSSTAGYRSSALGKLKAFISLTKPRQLALLMLTMYGAYFAGGGSLDPRMLALLTIMGFTSIGGVTAFNMYFDRDIDAIMGRTRRRPLPSGVLNPYEALAGSLALVIAGVLSAAAINTYVALTVIAGLYFDIIAYTQLTKRFTPLSIIFGSIAGSMPALGGWAAAAGSITTGGVLMALIVFLWQPMHVWFLGYYFKEEYSVARIPILPSNGNPRLVSSLIAVSLAGLIAVAWAFALYYGYGFLTAVITTVLAALAISRIGGFARTGERREALKLFKFASPIIAVVFIILPLERTLVYTLLLG